MEEELMNEKKEQIIKNFIGNNSDVIYSKINKKFSFNVFCMLFTFFYFLYRKMYLVAVISFIIQGIIANYVKNTIVSLICFVIWGFAFYPLYKSHINRKIKKINIETISEEELKKKGGTSVVSVIIVPIVLFIILILSFGMRIFDSASKSLENSKTDDNYRVSTTINQNEYNYYSSHGVSITYGSDWKSDIIDMDTQTYKTLVNQQETIVFLCFNTDSISGENADYHIESNRQEYYNAFINLENAYGTEILKQSGRFQNFKDDFYVAWYEIFDESAYIRNYYVLDTNNNRVMLFMVLSEHSLNNLEETRIVELLKTIEYDKDVY